MTLEDPERVAMEWLIRELAQVRGVQPEDVVADLRAYLDAKRLHGGALNVAMSFLAVLNSEPAPEPATMADFRAALNAGAQCDRLVQITREMDKKSKDYEDAKKMLTKVGCYMSTSTRTDFPPFPPPSTS